MKYKLGLYIFIYVVTLDSVSGVIAGLGCYKENKRHRYFRRNPGDFDPGNLTPTVCAAKCGSFQFSYAAIAEGRFCFCGDSLPADSLKDNSKCTEKCSGDSAQDCGSKDYVSVFTAAPPILGLTLTSSAGSNVLELHNPVTFTASLSSGGAQLAFKMDYDDGAGKTDQNATNMWNRKYHVPGHFKVSVYGNDQMQSLMEKEATTTVMVDAPVKMHTLECPLYMATHEEDFCTVGVLEGSNMELNYYENNVLKSTFTIADPPIYTTGPAIPTKGGTSILPGETASIIVMPASEFQYKSVIIGFELYAEVAGSIEILILSPVCSPSYCFDTNSCSGSCSGVHERSCISDEFCPASMSCWSSGACVNNPTRYDGTQRTNLNLVRSISHNIAAIGYNHISIDATTDYIEVDSGYVLGYKPIAGKLSTITVPAADSDVKTTDVTSNGLQQALPAMKRHLLRAVSSGGSGAYIPVKFTSSGIKDITVTVSNKRIVRKETNTTQITVIEGIDKAIINIPKYIEKGLSTPFQLLPHTGTNVTYTWDFGDGTIINTTDAIHGYIYSTVGELTVSVTAFNPLSTKTNTTVIQVEERISSLTLTDSVAIVDEITSIPTPMTTGSNYTCTWKKDGVTTATTTDTTSPVGGTFDYQFTDEGTFQMSVICLNNINQESASAQFSTEYRITNLQLVKTGALTNQEYSVNWTWTGGTNPTFMLTFDSVQRSFTKDPYFNRAYSETFPPVASSTQYPMNLTAYNRVSNEQIITNFGIEAEVTSPAITCGGCIDASKGYGTIAKGDSVTFDVTATGGTTVTVDWNYDDGSPVDRETFSTWPNTVQSKTHTFARLGWFNVEVKIHNLYNSHTEQFRLLAIAPVQNLIMVVSPNPVLFAPPATVSISFTKNAGDDDPNEAKMIIDYGDGNKGTVDFDVNQVYTYEYREAHGSQTYSIVANVSNAISQQTVSGSVQLVEKIRDVEIETVPLNAARGDSVNVNVKMRMGGTGTDVTIEWDFGHALVGPRSRVGTSPDGVDTETVTYNTVGTYTITIKVKSSMETVIKTKQIICQEKITRDLIITSDHPKDFTNSAGTIQYTFRYTSTPPPTDATITVNYGDNKEETKPAAWLSSNTQETMSHIYAQDGNYITTFTLSNLVSTEEFSISSGVYLDFTNLAATPMYKPFVPINGPDENGFGTNKDIFPHDTSVKFHMSKTQGTHVYYSVLASNGADVIICNKTNEDVFEMFFNETGTYSVEITAKNPMYSSTTVKSVTIMKKVIGLSIQYDGQPTKENEPKLFYASFDEPGTSTCVYVNYGDGSSDLFGDTATCQSSEYFGQATYVGTFTGNNLQVNHTFISKNTYEISMKAFNAYSQSNASVSHVVSALDCSMPQLDIKYKHIKFWEPEVIEKSKRVRVIGETSISCGMILENQKKWLVETVDENYGTEISTIDLSAISSREKAELGLPARYLNEGLYKFTYIMEMKADAFANNETFKSMVSTYIKIIPSQLVVKIFPGGMSKVQRGHNMLTTIDPFSNSYDPDLLDGSTQSFSNFTWYCREVNEEWPTTENPSKPYSTAELAANPVDNGGCFMQGPGRIDTIAGSLLFDTGNMKINKTYEIKVAAYKTGHQHAETSAYITIVEGVPPEITIRCSNEKLCVPKANGLMISPSTRLGLLGDCTSGCDSNTAFKWKLYTKDYQWIWKEVINLPSKSDGVESMNIAINKTLFEEFPNVTEYQVSITATTSNGDTATAYTNLMINTPPVGGICSISPKVGTVLQTNFTIDCNSWSDDDGIEEYQSFCKFGGGDGILKQIAFGGESKYFGKLPLGPDYNDYKMNCFTRIKDKASSYTSVDLGEIQVNPLPVSDVTDMFTDMKKNIADSFDKIAAEGSVNDVNSLALAYSTLISMASQNDSLEYDNILIAARETSTGMGPDFANRTSAFTTTPMDPEVEKQRKQEYEEKRNTRAEFTSQIMSALENCTISTTSAIALTGSTMAELTQFTENCGRDCQETAADLAGNMIDTLEELSSTSSKEDMVEAAEGILAALANVQEAGKVHKTNPTLGDKESVKPYAVYDTDLESPEKAMPADITDFSEGGDTLLLYTSEGFQEKTSTFCESKKQKTLSILRNVLDKALVPGEKPVVINTPKMTVQFEKNDASQVSNKTLDIGNAKVELPSWCEMQTGPCDTSKTVMIQSTYSTFAPYQDAGSASQISPRSGAISIDFYDSTGGTIGVKNTVKPITLFIPFDPLNPKPEAKHVVPYIPDRDQEYFYYHTAEINLDRGSLHVNIDIEDPSVQFLVVVRLGAFPNITTKEFDFSCLVGPATGQASVSDGSVTNSCYISSDEINGYKGKVYIGVREVRPYEHERYRENRLIPTSFPKSNNFFTTNYTITTITASCNYYNVFNKQWQSDGCNVGPETNVSLAQCICNHLTTFAGGWVVMPNTIDWNFVFSNADFMKNPTLYATMITITVVYLVVVVWARRQDKRDVEKLGLTPLADNDKGDKYFYEIVVVTGMRRKAGTDSKVQFILSGEDDETDVRTLSDTKRKPFRRGGVDGFLMSVPRPLGYLNYLHIWHDNSGKGTQASWYLRSVVIRDVQTDQKFIFISNRWFAVEEDDGQVDRVIPVAGKEQMIEFSHLFTEKTTKSLSDGHLWFSVVARPPQSRFTRVQRVSCCLCLLYLSMLTNAMFYEKDEGNKSYTFGPFALSPEQIYIGIISNIIVFPATFLIITLFRKSRPKNKRPSRVQTALNNTTKRATSMTDVNPTLENTREGTLTPSVLLEQKNRPDTSLSRGYTSLSVGELAEKPSKKKKKMDCPWYFVIFAWILLWLATLTAAAFVLFYGIQFQDIKCKKWITSMLISFFASVFVTQPIKVFLTAIVLSLIVKNPGSEDDDEEEDEEKPHLSADEQLLHEDSLYSATRPKRAAYAPPDPVLMEKARQVRLKEIKMWGVVRELLFYAFFLWILMIISYRNRSQLMYRYKHSMEQVFIVTNDTNHWFMKAKNQEDFWSWAKSGMGNGLRALNYYNDEQPLFLRGYINDKQSRIMGYATMRQLRVTPGSCTVAEEVKGIIHECNDEYSITNQQEGSYGVGWSPLVGNSTREEYRYTTANELEGYPYWGELGMYSGGGYVVRLRGNASALRWKMEQLQSEEWIDKYTRAVFIEFTVYNPGINLFAVSTMLAEFRPSQGIVPSYRFEPVMLFPYMNSAMLFVVACEITYMLFTLYFIIAEIRNIYKEKVAYFKEFWNLVELAICAMSVTAVVIYFYRMFETNRLTERFKVSHGNEYMKFQYIGYWSEIFTYIIGFLVFFATLKFLKLLRFNKKICMLASTMKASVKDLLHFSVIFNIVFLAFIQLFYMIYVANIKSFKNFVTSCESGIVMMMGKFDIYAMKAAQPVLTQIFIFLYVVMITFIVVNMFLSILNETFTSVRVDTNKQANDYEIVQFMIGRLKMWTGLGTPDKSVLKPNSVQAADKRGPAELFPDQIDRLLHSISHIYMEKERMDELFDRNAYHKGKGADLPMFEPPSVRSLKYEKMTTVQT